MSQDMFDGEMPVDVMRAMLQLNNVLFEDENLDAVLNLVCIQAKYTIPGADDVTVTVGVDSGSETRAYTSEVVKAVDEDQYRTNEGPCVDAMRELKAFEIESMPTETRWPRFTPAARDKGVMSSLALPLHTADRRLGALNIYAFKPFAFADEARNIASLLAGHASTLVANAIAFMSRSELSQQLHSALESRDVIGTAKGIIMEREGVSVDEAFEMLVRISQNRNVKLRDIAYQLVQRQRTAERA